MSRTVRFVCNITGKSSVEALDYTIKIPKVKQEAQCNVIVLL